MSEKRRIGWIDQLRGLAFYTVVFGHMEIPKQLKTWIYSFHMPLFFLITGLTYNIEKVYETSFKDYVSRQAKRILVPYFWLQMLNFIVKYFADRFGRHKGLPVPEYLLGMLYGNSKTVDSHSIPTYYVLLLLLVLICLWIVVRITKGNRTAMFAIISLSLVISICTQKLPLPWHLNVVPTGMFFVFTGRMLMDAYVIYREKLEKLNKAVYMGACMILAGLGYILNLYNGRVSVHSNTYGKDYMVFIICSVLTSAAFILIVMLLPDFRIFSFIGKNSFFLLCVHFPCIELMEAIVTKKYESHWLFIAVGSLFCYFGVAAAAWLANRFFPYICGKPVKDETTIIKIGEYLVIAAAGAVPYLYFNNHFMNGVLRSTVPLMVISALTYLVLVVLVRAVFSRFMPFMFLKEKESSKKALCLN